MIQKGDVMNLLFKNTTRYSETLYKQFLEFHQNKYRFRYMLFTFIIVILLITLLIVQIKSYNYTFAFLFCFVITVFILWRYFHPTSIVTKELNSKKIKEQKSFTFEFYDKYFKVSNEDEYSIVKYHELRKIFDTKDFFYMYLDRKNAFILDKSCFEKGSSNEFSEFINKKCFFKYSIQKSSKK